MIGSLAVQQPQTVRGFIADYGGDRITLALDVNMVDGVPMVATAGWFQQLMACPGPQRIQVLDEAWALLGSERTSRYLQACWKLSRSYGVANIAIVVPRTNSRKSG